MTIFIVGTPFLVVLIVIIHLIVQNRQKERRIASKDEMIEQLVKQVEGMKRRHLTAKGGLSREEKEKVLDMIAKADALEDDAGLVTLRAQDMKRALIKMLNQEKEKK